jgi:hypothetical protein
MHGDLCAGVGASCLPVLFLMSFVMPAAPDQLFACLPCRALCCPSGDVALTRAADEECLQILHVWRP